MTADPHQRPTRPPDWRDRAACRGHDWRTFFPATHGAALLEPLAICAHCPVKQTCLETALANEDQQHRSYRAGIWGGTTPKQRHHIAAQRRQQEQEAA